MEKIMPENPSEREIKKVASAQGILSMRQDGVVKILNGITSFEEVQSVVDLNEEKKKIKKALISKQSF